VKCYPMDTVCPHCGQHNDHNTESVPDGGPVRALPIDGDYSLCVGCATVSMFVNGPLGMFVRPLTAAEELEALVDPDVQEWVGKIQGRRR